MGGGGGLPWAVLGVVRGDVDVGDLLLDDPEVRGGEGAAWGEEMLHHFYALLYLL